jgi:ribonuclease T2
MLELDDRSVEQLDKIENNLNHYWSNIKCPATDGVNSWKSAWNSYGVCSKLKQVDYFRAGLNLRKQADVLSALAEQGIKPDYKLYSTEKIKWAVKQQLGVTPGVQCRDGPFGKQQLYEVYLCVDTDAETIECPKLPAGLKCPDQVVFHPFYSWMLNTTSAAVFDARIRLPTETMIWTN